MKRKILFAAMALFLLDVAIAQTPVRQGTSRDVRICGVVAVGDGFTPVTTLALGAADEAEALRAGTATLDISGATFAAVTGADGCYDLTLDTTATNTVGDLTVVIQDDSLILPMREKYTVLEEAVYDNFYGAAAVGPLTAAAVNAEVDTGLADYDAPTNAELTARSRATADYFDFTSDTVDVGEWLGVAVTALETATDFSADLLGTSCAAPSVGSIEEQLCTDIDAVLVDTAAGGVGPWTTGGGSAAPTEAEIYTYFTSLAREDLFKSDVSLLATAAALATVDANVDAVLADTTSGGAGPWTTGGGAAAPTEAEMYTYFTSLSREDLFKADVTLLALASALATAQADLDIITGTNGVLVDNDAIGAAQMAANAIGPSEVADNAIDANALAADAASEIEAAVRAGIISGSVDTECALEVMIALAAGEFTQAGNVRTYRDIADTVDIIVGTISGTTRSSMTITCP